MSGDIFDKIAASRPVNAQTAKTMGGGVRYQAKISETTKHWAAPPKMLPVPENATSQVGKSFGRFTVIGYFGNENTARKALWIVRCICGDYETRSHKAINNPNNSDDRCVNCRRTVALAKRASRMAQKLPVGEPRA